MDYPLGSFPRFGHQERWAQQRREVAAQNSRATIRANFLYHFEIEREIYDMMAEVIATATATRPEGVTQLAEINRRLLRIKRAHDLEKRVYYDCLGRAFQLLCRCTGLSDDVVALDGEKLKRFMEALGEQRMEAKTGSSEAIKRMCREEADRRLSGNATDTAGWYEIFGPKVFWAALLVIALFKFCAACS